MKRALAHAGFFLVLLSAVYANGIGQRTPAWMALIGAALLIPYLEQRP